jgi:hypothetical protein
VASTGNDHHIKKEAKILCLHIQPKFGLLLVAGAYSTPKNIPSNTLKEKALTEKSKPEK